MLEFDPYDLEMDADDINAFHTPYEWGDKITNHNICQSLMAKPVICYDHLCLDDSEFGFRQECFDNKDIKCYFETLKDICNSSISDLIDDICANELHLYQTKGHNIIEAIKRNYCKEIRNSELPVIYHFALYTAKDGKASRHTGIKSPRIHFLVGQHGMLYILFYDPFHKMTN